MLRDHTLDVVLSTFSIGEDTSSELYTHLLTQSPLCLVVATPLKRVKKLPLNEALQAVRLFLPSSTFESRSDFDQYVEVNNLKLKIMGEVDDIALLRILALTNKGAVIIPLVGILGDIENSALTLVHEFKSIKQKFYAITRQKKFQNPIISELVRSFRR